MAARFGWGWIFPTGRALRHAGRAVVLTPSGPLGPSVIDACPAEALIYARSRAAQRWQAPLATSSGRTAIQAASAHHITP